MKIKLETKISRREDDHSKKFDVTLLHSNIVTKGKARLPEFQSQDFIEFISDYSVIYDEFSDGKVNTRLLLVFNSQILKDTVYYCRLNWFQRRMLSYIERRTIFQTNPFYAWMTILALILSILALIFGK